MLSDGSSNCDFNADRITVDTFLCFLGLFFGFTATASAMFVCKQTQSHVTDDDSISVSKTSRKIPDYDFSQSSL